MRREGRAQAIVWLGGAGRPPPRRERESAPAHGCVSGFFCGAADMETLTGMEIGGVTPFGLPKNLPLYVDARILDYPWVIVGAGGRSAKLRLDPRMFERLGATFIPDLGL